MSAVEEIIKYAEECIDTKFVHQGRLCGTGLDCAGVVKHAYENAGLDMSDVPGYGKVFPDPKKMHAALTATCVPVSRRKYQPGDILYIEYDEPRHLAIYIGNNEIIHAYLARRKVVRERMDAIMKSKIVRAYRHRSLVE